MRRSTTSRLLMGMFVSAVFFAGAELILRLTLPIVRTSTLPDTMVNEHIMQKHAYRYDEDLFWYWAVLPVFKEHVNDHGFRRVAPMTVTKPAGVTRVITFGDSQTYGAGVQADQTYSAFAEAALGPEWEVLNAGLSGYRTLNIYRLLQKKMLNFDPDIIVIDCMPFDSARDDGPTTVAAEGGWVNDLRGLLWNSRIYYVLRYGVEKTRFNKPQWLDQAGARQPPESLGFGNHDLIAKWADDHGIQTVFLYYPVRNNDYLGCKTVPEALPPGYPTVNACARLAASGHTAPALFQDTNHLTVLGNQVVGDALAEVLRSLRQ